MYSNTETKDFMEKISKRGIVLGLESEKNILKRLGNPQKKYKIIHIAGTNGKGSISSFIAQILISAGYKTGIYNSPAVNNRFEIIKVNNKEITNEDYADCISAVKFADTDNKVTAYEAETAAAFLWFEKCGCDVAVIEVGMGGKDDATNIFDEKECAVFASISKDHTDVLGADVMEIARNKAGIIIGTSFVVSAQQVCEAEKELIKKCQKENSILIFADFSQICNIKFNGKTQNFDYKNFKNIEISLLGNFQCENAAVSIETAFVLRNCGFKISDDNIYEGLKNTIHKGRFEIICTNPLFIVDGAHNENAVIRLCETIKEYFNNKKIYFIIGVFADKDYKKIIEIAAPMGEVIFAVEPKNKRALPKEKLAEEIANINKNVYSTEIDDAVKRAVFLAKEEGVIVSFGSLSFINEIKKYI